ncbi:MAG TPA: zinc-binding dehydrogenase [Jatrophihabitantaceae bacterium]|jgi:NADPH:quinone reductase-like Zn-dependent oxidoreductase|nr:zinc-binding dehydrogenase [Jatrophihabitantaceae bacterium]
MRALFAAAPNPDDPLSAARVGERPDPEADKGWTVVEVKAASLNHHDLWTLRGVGITPEQFPMILGCDAAGVDPDTGAEVVVHGVVSSPDWTGDDTLDPGRTLLSEKYQGTLAERVAVPTRNLVSKPAGLSFLHAACLPTAWLTAYRMLFVKAGLTPGQTVLVQGGAGGVGSAAVAMARMAGLRVWATGRTEAKRQAARGLGAHETFEPGARLPERVDAVLETVGEATWAHSLRSLKPGGRIVVAGATSGAMPPADLRRVFFLQLSVIGSTMGTRAELEALMSFLTSTGLRPNVHQVLPLDAARDGLAAMERGEVVGKIVIEP